MVIALLVIYLSSSSTVYSCVQPISNYATTNNNATVVGTISNYTCKAGYSFPNGATSVVFTCQVGDIWSPSVTACQLPCPNLAVTNAVTTYFGNGAAPGTSATVQCIPGYLFADSATAKSPKCLASREWSLTVPSTCLPIQCKPFANISHAQPDTLATSYPVKVNYSCDTSPEQYYFPDATMWRVTQCTQYGDWSQLIPGCILYGDIPNGDITHVKSQVEANGAVSITTIVLALLGIMLGVILILDIVTFPRQLYFLKKNLHSRFPSCCKSVKDEPEEFAIPDIASLKSAIFKSMSSIRNVKVTPSPSIADLDPLRDGSQGPSGENDPLVHFLVTEPIVSTPASNDGIAAKVSPAAAAATDTTRARIASARASVRRAMEMTAVGKRLMSAVKSYRSRFSTNTLPLGTQNSGNPIGPPVETINEAYESEDGDEDGDSYTDDSDEDGDIENGGQRHHHKTDIAIHEA